MPQRGQIMLMLLHQASAVAKLFKPSPKPLKLDFKNGNFIRPINDKNGIDAIINTAAGANNIVLPIPANTFALPIERKPAAKSWKEFTDFFTISSS